MINFTDKGAGLTPWLQLHGAALAEVYDGGAVRWESNKTDAEINALIEAYNPWPTEKAAKIAELNLWFSDAVAQLTAGTTDRERESWAVQVNEAYGIRPPAMLAAMAAARGVALEDLIAKVKAKAELYAAHYGAIQGRRDAAEDLVKAFPDSGPPDRLPELWAVKC